MGIWEYICLPFGYLIKFCYDLTGSYAIALFLFALVVKIILFPFGVKQQKNSIKQAKMRPKEQAIRNKYAGRTDQATQQKMQQEIMDFYQKEGYNPAGGCLPLLIQMPIIFALYSVVRNPLTYISRISADAITKIKEIAAGIINNGAEVTANQLKNLDEINVIDTIVNNPDAFEGLVEVSQLPDMSLFGFSLASTPSLGTLFTTITLIPLFVLVTGYLQQFVIQKLSYQPSPEAAQQMKTMNMVMPLMSVWFSFMLPAALGLYWAFQNLLAMAQQFILSKVYPIPVITEEEMKAAEREYKANKKNNAKVVPDKRRSLIYDDDDVPSEPVAESVNKKQSTAKESDKTQELISPAPLKEDNNTENN